MKSVKGKQRMMNGGFLLVNVEFISIDMIELNPNQIQCMMCFAIEIHFEYFNLFPLASSSI